MNPKLFTPLTLGPLTLQHRVVMAPLTRMRASPDGNVPTALNALYYAQRATPGGLLIAEATPVSWQGHGHPNVPGIHTAAQVDGWRRVTDAVHAQRRLHRAAAVAHRARLAFQPPAGSRGAGRPVGHRRAGHDDRRRLEERALRSAARAGHWPRCRRWSTAGARPRRHAMQAGFDGVEVHGANGYLLEQFLQSRSNTRSDRYGGSIENRCRLHLEIAAAVAQEVRRRAHRHPPVALGHRQRQRRGRAAAAVHATWCASWPG